MNKQIESLKLALTALEINLTLLEKITPYKGQEDFLSDAIAITQNTTTFIKKALAQPEQPAQPEQEPSGHFLDFAYSDSIAYVHVYDQFRKGQQFYKAPPQRTWVGLTDEEREEIALEVPMDAVLITEAKLKEKNNG